MAINPDVFPRYLQLLSYKISKYLGPEFESNFTKYTTSQKITFIAKLQSDLNGAFISDILTKNIETINPVLEVLREIYNFLYTDNNKFSQKSYLAWLKDIKNVEDRGGNPDSLKEKLKDLENAIISKIRYDLNKLQPLIKNNDIKEKSSNLIKSGGSFIGAGLCFLLAATLICNAVTKELTPIVHNNKIVSEWIAKQNTPNPLVNAAQFLRLADTCTAWALIRSLDTLSINTKTSIYFEKAIDWDASMRFERLCKLAVNYTISEYSKISKIPITNIPDSVKINFFEQEGDSSLAAYYPSYDSIRINNENFKFGIEGFSEDAHTLVLFSVIAHETIHLINDNNDPFAKKILYFENKFDGLKKTNHKLDPKEVEEYIKLQEDNDKFTEIEAAKFDHMLFEKLFRSVLIDAGKSIEFAQSYWDNVVTKIAFDLPGNEPGKYKFDSDQEINKEIFSSLADAMNLITPLKMRIDYINSGKYNAIGTKYKAQRKELLH